MTQRNIQLIDQLSPVPTFGSGPAGSRSVALMNGLILLVTLLITVLAGAGFGYV